MESCISWVLFAVLQSVSVSEWSVEAWVWAQMRKRRGWVGRGARWLRARTMRQPLTLLLLAVACATASAQIAWTPIFLDGSSEYIISLVSTGTNCGSILTCATDNWKFCCDHEEAKLVDLIESYACLCHKVYLKKINQRDLIFYASGYCNPTPYNLFNR